MILKKLIFFVAAAVLQPSSSYWHSSSDILPPKKPTKPTLKVPTLFLFCFGRIMNHLSDLFVEISFGYPFLEPPDWYESPPRQVVPSYLRWNALVRRRLKSSTPWPVWGKEKNGGWPFPPKGLFGDFRGKKRREGFQNFSGFFSSIYDHPFFVGYLFCFFRGFTRPRWQLHRFPFRTTTSSLFFCPLAVKNNRGGRGHIWPAFCGQSWWWIERNVYVAF